MQHLAQQLCTVRHAADYPQHMAETLLPNTIACVWQVVANMHERGIAWRDAKPQNIMCTAGHGTDNPLVAVFDFGVSLPMKVGEHPVFEDSSQHIERSCKTVTTCDVSFGLMLCAYAMH